MNEGLVSLVVILLPLSFISERLANLLKLVLPIAWFGNLTSREKDPAKEKKRELKILSISLAAGLAVAFAVKADLFSILHLTNLGSWQEGSWLSSIHRYADQYFARFVIHAYVLGIWNVKPFTISEPEPRSPFELKRSGLLDFLLPDFGLGFFGKLLSGGGWLLIGLILLVFFFPPLGILLNKLLGWVVALVPGAKYFL